MGNISTPIVHKVLVRAPREKVYDALTSSDGLDKWFTSGAEIDLRAGGCITFRWIDWGPDKVSEEATGRIVEVRRPERFVFKWWSDHYTTVEISFSEVEEGTVVELREYGYEDSAEGLRRCLSVATGWGEALTLLKFYLEHGVKY